MWTGPLACLNVMYIEELACRYDIKNVGHAVSELGSKLIPNVWNDIFCM